MWVDSGISETKSQKVSCAARSLRNLMVRLGLDCVDEVGEFHRILDEEDGHVVADQVPIALVDCGNEAPGAPVTVDLLCPRSILSEQRQELVGEKRLTHPARRRG